MTLGKPGPFQVIADEAPQDPKLPIEPPRRRYECSNYEFCLDLAAALNWDNFTCRGCSGEIAQPLLWQANQCARKDQVIRKICSLPQIQCLSEPAHNEPLQLKYAGKT